MNEVGSRLRRLRRDLRLSQTDLAGDRFTASYVSHIERGRRRISAEALEYFAQQLGVDQDQLRDERRDGHEPTPSAMATNFLVESDTAWREQDHARVLRLTEEAVAGIDRREHPELWWVVQHRRVDAHLARGEHADALTVCQDLLREPVTRADSSLHMRVLAKKADAARGLRRMGDAVSAAQEAVNRAAELSPEHRLLALRSLIAAAAAADHEPMLQRAHSQLRGLDITHLPPVAAGQAYWAMGDAWLVRGEVVHGSRCHERAALLMRGQVDLRTWGRFCKDSARVRMGAGIVDGIRPLVQEFTVCLNRAGTATDRAEALVVAAQLAVLTGDMAEATRLLAAADRSVGDSDDEVLALRDRLRAEVARDKRPVPAAVRRRAT
ncbi:helix-turn-helix domain-containing protein [Luteipulveratus mongoliensis]|uniref:HTH cro/C1-type domain-containing protein n=1 Tax=Luteipulveratus mongoliensis TaxID=571913 RepID=A0A0K1JH45_9MICO|nr:helix-turn-helix transcriptional regulator [Luteipulveratus mongoliensis]AKU15908.1 hypothetical protein VV02_08670 [Luteipulveratus mongoliensis]